MWHEEVEGLVERVVGTVLPGSHGPVDVRRSPAHGDWSTAVAITAAHRARAGAGTPAELARVLCVELVRDVRVAGAISAPSGHVNVVLTSGALGGVVRDLVSGRHPPRPATGVVPGQPAGASASAMAAHARTRNLARAAAAHGVRRPVAFVAELLDDPRERRLMLVLAENARALAASVRTGRGQPLRDHLAEVADAHGDWYAHTRLTPRGGGMMDPVHGTRLWLNDATGLALARGLRTLDLDPPEHL